MNKSEVLVFVLTKNFLDVLFIAVLSYIIVSKGVSGVLFDFSNILSVFLSVLSFIWILGSYSVLQEEYRKKLEEEVKLKERREAFKK